MKIIRFFVKSFLALTLLILITWSIVLGILQTKSGQKWAFKKVKGYLEQTTQTTVKIKKFDFSFPLNLRLEGVTVSQDKHPILGIKAMELSCACSSLLQGKIVFSQLKAEDMHVFASPSFSSSAELTPSPPWEIPFLPFYVKFENIDIQRIRFHPLWIDTLKLPSEIEHIFTSSTFNLQGLVSNNPFRSALIAHLLLTTKHEQTDLFTLGVDTQNHQLSLSFHSNDFPFILFNSHVPPQLKGHIALYAHAPVSAWQSLAADPEDNHEPIEGHFKITLMPWIDNSHPINSLIGEQTVLKSHYLLTSLHALELINLKLDNPLYSLVGEVILNADHTLTQSHLQGEIKDLKSLQPWIEVPIEGMLTFDGHVSGPLFSPLITADLNAPYLLIDRHSFQHVHSTLKTDPHLNGVNTLFTLAFDYQQRPWKISSTCDWIPHKQVTFAQLQIDSLQSQLQGELHYSLSDFMWEGWIKGHLRDLSDFSSDLKSPISGEGQFNLQFMAIENDHLERMQAIRGEGIGHALQWKEGYAQHLTLNFQMDPLANHPSLAHAQGLLKGEQLKWKDEGIGQVIIHFSHDLDLKQWSLHHLIAQWEAQDITWSTGQAVKAAGHCAFEDPLQKFEGEVDFVLHELSTSSLKLKECMGSTRWELNGQPFPFQLKGYGMWKEDLLFAINGHWQYQHNRLEMNIQHFTGRFGPYPFQIKQPLYFYRDMHEMHLSHLWFQWGEGEIQGEFHQDPHHLFSQIKTNAVPSELFHFINPDLPLTGRATFQGKIEGSPHHPQGQLQVDLHHMQITEELFAQKPFVAGKLLLNLDEQGIQLQSELTGIGNTPLRITGQLPFQLNMTPIDFKMNPDLPFNLSFHAEGELDPYLHLFYNDTTNLSGHAVVALNLSGQITAPQIKGYIDLTRGTYESLSTGALYHNIQAHLEGDGSKIILTQLSAQDSKNGHISATGIVNMDATQSFPFEFDIHPSHVFILDSDYVDISASGTLSLVGNMKQSRLQGELNVDQASIHLEEALPRKIKHIDIKYINATKEDPIPRYFEKRENPSSLELNVKLNALQSIHIEGNHVKSEWKGSLALMGTPEHLLLHGDLRLARGEYNFNGKVFNLTQGNIHFAGAPDKKTSLYVVASKEIDRITAEIIVKGAITKPVISFRSTPPLSQREVLSYILFNRGISDITQDQGDQLSQSFISLNSSEQTESSDDFLSRLRNNIGIDRLDFTTADRENKDFGLQVGKHITDNVMISVNQSMVSLSPIIAVEAKLHKNIKAQAEAGVVQDAPIRMSIKWKKDY